MTVPISPVTLDGRIVRLEPLSLDRHFEDLCRVALEPELWKWTLNIVATPAELREYLEIGLAEQAQGKALPFAVVEQSSGRAIGSTRYANIEPLHRRLEIGWTWYGLPYQRTGCNTESKLLLLTHAFEKLGMRRVELKTDALNVKSRAAIQRIGASFEGIFRKHGIAVGGRNRDTAYYSIIDDEWPTVKESLAAKFQP
ncbi:MAG TPA: GNAT family protein [Gemmatimonadales bacterium]|jgi:RimJ/RimL family protein N-acetyltransferase